ncbi:alpha/beta fold hydrolase [Nocardioides antri]|uniref:Alpha/beta fold hydrolase n=1 Tax=Nocardioides antri TaxID=2607659 RepID=A0A5B1LYI5_9ACTN|nr:alpha/beta fold hydrolase [Nocardioides antri]KAA1425723.1 alpha/beta fold hydrolase [Nocardioides antri]
MTTTDTIDHADTPGGALAYVRRGAGEPLLLVMGVGGHHGMWSEAFLAELAEQFDVVAFDHRGIGSSARAEADFTIGDLATDALAVMDHVGWESAHVMGISMGGTVAQQVALTAPERVRTLTLGCTWPGALPDGAPVWGEAVRDIASAATSGDLMTAARLMFAANVSPEFAEQPGAFEAFTTVAGAVKVPGPVILMQMSAATAHDAVDRLGDLDIPTLVLHGTLDRVIRPDGGVRLAELIPGARLELLDGAGHLFFWERPEESARLVREFAAG